ncbi:MULTISPECIES: FHA domain-containing protein [Calothrix]|uniref:FHA domain-containing protein n=2 Tax=Calothrix TaxID=1186 RepID=A0ABR8A9W1_9CYAN|nr:MULTISPECIES: FHA domain-containing protein [Calothrix]MBD2195562.1 FHA domain-containing protein [Calothrix parietina FACHB-288]MBD2224113.1 FHA domain-containing protein [Calothrix anomala FACHB-343]
MPIYQCPKGHESTESDFCSECGAKILGIAEPKIAKTTVNIETCPACSAPHEVDSGDYCEICGYNFVTQAHGELAIAKIPQEEKVTQKQASVSTPPSPIIGWQLVVTIDPSLRHPESPEPPTAQAPIVFPLEKETNLIGRNSQARAIHPEIALDFDGAVSHRHALLNRQADGTFTLRDIGSSNGTQFKGVELKPMVDISLQDGDEFTLGHWTRIAIAAIR